MITKRQMDRVADDFEMLNYERDLVELLGRRDWSGLAEAAANAARYFEDHLLRFAVSAMRDSGATWEEVGEAVGMSRQGAQQRWGGQP